MYDACRSFKRKKTAGFCKQVKNPAYHRISKRRTALRKWLIKTNSVSDVAQAHSPNEENACDRVGGRCGVENAWAPLQRKSETETRQRRARLSIRRSIPKPSWVGSASARRGGVAAATEKSYISQGFETAHHPEDMAASEMLSRTCVSPGIEKQKLRIFKVPREAFPFSN